MERQPRPDNPGNAETILDGLVGGDRPAPAPERIGAYRVEGRLGFGGMGEVFLAWDERLERRVAIKRIRQNAGLSPEQRERFRREARLAARLSHPAVVQIHDLISDGADDAIVMELIEGRTVEERLAAGRLETAEVLRLALEIAEGLAAAHEAGLVHRDLKAANVIISRSGHAKILDFGLARPVVRAPEDQGFTRQGVVLGTCHAMSPEQARGEEVDERSDLFSFGALVHEMLTGRPPFRGNNPIDSLRRVVTEEAVDPCKARPDLPPDAVKLLRRLLAKDRDDRPAGAREVIEILERLQTAPSTPPAVAQEKSVSEFPTCDATVLERPAPFHRDPKPTSVGKPPAWTRRRLLLVGGTAVLLVTAMAVALFLKTWSARPLRVAVILKAHSQDPELERAASAVRSAALQALTRLEKITPVAPEEVTRVDGTPVQIGKAVSADQILLISLERVDGTALVTLERIAVRSGEVLESLQFYIPLRRENRLTLAKAVISKTQEIYSEHEQPGLVVQDEDYATFMDIQERVDAGEVRPGDLDQLEAVMSTSPRFLEARILAARIAHSLFQSRREPADLARASTYIRKARILAPEDPRTLRQEFQITLTRDRLREAQVILEKLGELDPGDPEILPLRAELAEKQDDLDGAVALLNEAVDQVPSWQNRYRLALLEGRRGQIVAAREQINAILEQSRDNIWAREALGALELVHGDLSEAETIYRSLLPSIQKERALSSLGSINLMLGRYAEAANLYHQALAVNPDYAYALFNLAEIESELGDESQASARYRRALDRLMESEADAELLPATALLKAQCLARLGRTREAVAIAREELRRSPKDPGLLAQSTLVYSLAGKRTLAIKHAKAALARGARPRNFTGPGLQWLRDVPELRPLLEGPP